METLSTQIEGVGRQNEVCCEGIRKKESEKVVISKSLVIKERKELSSS